MIVVAIVGLLSALASQEFYHMTFRAKRSELSTNLDAIRTMEFAYEAEWGSFTTCALAPPVIPGRTATSFPATLTTNFDWNLLGWVPDGKVYGQYEVLAAPRSQGVVSGFTGTATSDIDGDGNYARYVTNRDVKPGLTTANIVY